MSNCFNKYLNYIQMCKKYQEKSKERSDKKKINDISQDEKNLMIKKINKEIYILEREKLEMLLDLQIQCPKTYDFYVYMINHLPFIDNYERDFPKRRFYDNIY